MIVAGRAVRLACDRHLRDLARQGTPDFPYRFDPTRVAALLEFFTDYLTLDDVDAAGRPLPFRLMRWLQFAYGSLVGWVNLKGALRFVEAYFESGKGTTKTPAAAGYGLYRLVGANRFNVQNYSLGVNGDQANYLYGFAKRMCERSEDLCDLLDVGEYNTAWVERNSFFRPLTSEGRSLDNKVVYTALIDELHEVPAIIPEKMRLGIKSQTDAQIIMLTNAGFDKTSVCWTKHDYGLKVLEGVVVDEQYFAYICQLDPCEAHRQDGATQPDDSCAACDRFTDERVWPKVNPAILEIPSLYPYLRGIVKQAINQPSTLSRVKRLSFCIWTQGRSVWITSDKWDACKATSPLATSADGRACAVGFDMSEKLDLTACAMGLRVDDEPDAPGDVVELVDVDNGQETKKTLNINFCVELAVHFWLPRDTLIQRVKNEQIPFDVWEKDGQLRVTPGPVIDYDLIYEQFKDELAPPFRPDRIGYDKHNASQFALQLRDKARFTVVEVAQGRALSESFKLFEALVRLRRIRHNGNPVMAWCVSNADPKRDRYENLWLEKPSATLRIDGVIAAVIMLSQLVLLPPRRKKKAKVPRVWTPQGWKSLVDPPGLGDAHP